jgi:hypothetical protein
MDLNNEVLRTIPATMNYSAIKSRRPCVGVHVGRVKLGGGAPIVVQSMTNTDTADVEGTAQQIAALARAGSELVRITVDRDESAAAVAAIRDRVVQLGFDTPLVGDFHYNGHLLLTQYPDCAEALAKFRINPGNVGFREKQDRNFSTMIEIAARLGKAVRIGVNWGSLDQAMLTKLMDDNAKSSSPLPAREVMHEAVVQSGLLSAARAEELGLARNRIVISAKCSEVQDLIAVYRKLAARSDHCGINRGTCCFVARRHWRYHPHFADTRTGWRSHARGHCGSGDFANHGLACFCSHGHCLPWMWAHHVNRVSGIGAGYSKPCARPHAGMARGLSRI